MIVEPVTLPPEASISEALELMARYSFEQGLAVRLIPVEEMFAPGTLAELRV